ncbi:MULTISPECIES: hypothetical protein [unclassified Paenibacillus]|uniref:hypothetical protein n=2 Tax=Paenibacillus TaxID=44249 RepID=UPI0011613C08|nr:MULTISPECIES: hypothetical protein [unclassified Paenibacillus]
MKYRINRPRIGGFSFVQKKGGLFNMSLKKQIRQPTDAVVPDDLNKRSKKEWIESAVVLKRERFEIAGALFDCTDEALLS